MNKRRRDKKNRRKLEEKNFGCLSVLLWNEWMNERKKECFKKKKVEKENCSLLYKELRLKSYILKILYI